MLFDARGQLVQAVATFVITIVFWALGTATIKGAATWPWQWTVGIYIFHASMYALFVASMGYIGTALGYRKTEKVEEIVIENSDVDVEVNKDSV